MLAAVSAAAEKVGLQTSEHIFDRDMIGLNASAEAFCPQQHHRPSDILLRRRAKPSFPLKEDLTIDVQQLATAVECARRAIGSAVISPPYQDLLCLPSFDPTVGQTKKTSSFNFPQKNSSTPSSPLYNAASLSLASSSKSCYQWPPTGWRGSNASSGSGHSLDGCLDELVRNDLSFSDRLAKPFMSQDQYQPSSPRPFQVQDSVWMETDAVGPLSPNYFALTSAAGYHSSQFDDSRFAAHFYAHEERLAKGGIGHDMQAKEKDEVERERRRYRMHQRLSRMWRHEQQTLQWHWVASTYQQFASMLMAQQQQQHPLKQHNILMQAFSQPEQQVATADESESKPRTRRRYRRRRRRRNNKSGTSPEEVEVEDNDSRSGTSTPDERFSDAGDMAMEMH